MFVSVVNFFKATVPGHIFRGKKRLVKRVSKKAMETLVREYDRQEAIMLLLRHPYLTQEESSGHVKIFGKREAKVKLWQEANALTKMKPHITLADRLNHLRVKENWD